MKTLSAPVLTLLHLLAYGAWLAVLAPGAGWSALVLLALLIWISVHDLMTCEIPDLASLLLFGAGAVVLWGQREANIADHIVGAVAWPLLFWGLAAIYRHRRGFDGLGFGDVKLMAGIGLWLGFAATIWVVLGAAVAGLVVMGLFQLMGGRNAQVNGQSAVAFGPFLCLSAWHVWLVGVSQ